MRIATWNVNSLKARQEAVERWLAKAEPDVLLIQETKLSDADAPVMPVRLRSVSVVWSKSNWGLLRMSKLMVQGLADPVRLKLVP